jgi:hypothetical protein
VTGRAGAAYEIARLRVAHLDFQRHPLALARVQHGEPGNRVKLIGAGRAPPAVQGGFV